MHFGSVFFIVLGVLYAGSVTHFSLARIVTTLIHSTSVGCLQSSPVRVSSAYLLYVLLIIGLTYYTSYLRHAQCLNVEQANLEQPIPIE